MSKTRLGRESHYSSGVKVREPVHALALNWVWITSAPTLPSLDWQWHRNGHYKGNIARTRHWQGQEVVCFTDTANLSARLSLIGIKDYSVQRWIQKGECLFSLTENGPTWAYSGDTRAMELHRYFMSAIRTMVSHCEVFVESLERNFDYI